MMGYPDCVLDLLPRTLGREGEFATLRGKEEEERAEVQGGGRGEGSPRRKQKGGGRERASATPPFEKVAILKKADTGFPDPCGKCPGVERATRALPALPLAAPALRSRLRGCASR